MSMRIINQDLAFQLISMETCVHLMEQVLSDLERGNAFMPIRSAMRVPEGHNVLATMPAYLKNPEVVGLKIITVFPGNESTPYESHQGGIMLFDCKNGLPLALVEASAVTAIRTAAVSAAATKILANEKADEAAILGSGTQARFHLEAMALVRPLRRIRIWSRKIENAEKLIREIQTPSGVEISATKTPEQAVRHAGVVCTATASVEPVLLGKYISEGVHINAVGACLPHTRELDTDLMRRSRLFVDRKESTMKEAGDFLIPRREGAISEDHIIGELGALIAGNVTGRTNPADITLFKSLGLAVEDIITAYHIYLEAEKAEAGLSVEFKGVRKTVGHGI